MHTVLTFLKSMTGASASDVGSIPSYFPIPDNTHLSLAEKKIYAYRFSHRDFHPNEEKILKKRFVAKGKIKPHA